MNVATSHATLRHLFKFLVALQLIQLPADAPEDEENDEEPIDPNAAAVQTLRLQIMQDSTIAKVYTLRLRPLGDELLALPAPLRNDVDINQALKDTEIIHDGYGGGSLLQIQSYQRIPDLPADVRAAIDTIQIVFVPSGSVFQASLPEEAQAAKERLALLEKHAEILRSVPVIGGTLYDWVKRYLEAGVRLETLLDQRDLVRAANIDRRRLITLRGEIIALLNRFRAALADEVPGSGLPANAVELIFKPLEELIARG